ncbi:MAG TPA: nucleotidyltransferase family protein [Candidatus Binataceae bacterium]|nr:nucleotidyltransferase family protein [Candidatus Binataceae bacterium]
MTSGRDSATGTTRIEGILLAAGESRRMGYPKPLLELNGKPFISAIASTMLTAVPRLIVVLGTEAERIARALPDDPRIMVVLNPNYSRGQLSSLKAGLASVENDAIGVMVHLCDHPTVRADTFRAVIDRFTKSGQPIAIARHAGRRGHPAIFARSVFAELMAAPDGEGARRVVNAAPGRVVYADVNDSGVNLDLDTPADLERAGISLPQPR